MTKPSTSSEPHRELEELRKADAPRGPAFRPSILEEGSERQALRDSHPLVSNSIEIATPAVRGIYSIIDRVIVNRLPGTNFVGDPRIGKTTAIGMICKMLARQHPKVPVGRLIALSHDRPSEGNFWGDLTQNLGLSLTSGRNIPATRTKVVNAILTQCSTTNSGVFVAICDEVQNWGARELNYMKDLGNILGNSGVSLITIGFGQRRLRQLKETLRGEHDLISRLLRVIYPMAGISDGTQLLSVLQQLDDPKWDYPVSSGVSYSEFFMPAAYAGGWRLGNESKKFWAAFDLVSRSAIKRPAQDVGMSSIVLAIKEFFLICEGIDSESFTGKNLTALEAVRQSGYTEALG